MVWYKVALARCGWENTRVTRLVRLLAGKRIMAQFGSTGFCAPAGSPNLSKYSRGGMCEEMATVYVGGGAGAGVHYRRRAWLADRARGAQGAGGRPRSLSGGYGPVRARGSA